MRSGAGDCLEGSASGPRDGSNYGYWHFIDCPCKLELKHQQLAHIVCPMKEQTDV